MYQQSLAIFNVYQFMLLYSTPIWNAFIVALYYIWYCYFCSPTDMCPCVKTIVWCNSAAVLSSRIILGITLVYKMSYKKLPDNRSMNDDVMFDANCQY